MKPVTEETPLKGYQGVDVEQQDDAALEEIQDIGYTHSSRSRLLLAMTSLTGIAVVAGFSGGLRGESAQLFRSGSNGFFNFNQPTTTMRNYTQVTWTPTGVKNVTLPVTEGGPETITQAMARVKKAQAQLEAELIQLKREKGALSSQFQGELNMQEAALEARLEQELEEQEQSLERTYEKEWLAKFEQLTGQIKSLRAKKKILQAHATQLQANEEDLRFHNQYYGQLQNHAGAVAAQGSQLQNNQFADLDDIDAATPNVKLPSSEYLSKFAYYPKMNSPGSNYMHINGTTDDIAAECISNPTCAGFNTNGLLKSQLQHPSQWTVSPSDGAGVQGLFAKSSP
mmetsp:Transcript_11863/g.17323  ORF Transcript_11863/g.17323 Transcript_11863/m.17323 type:complete len:341 (+) Transcript_11863:163-1185(+)|eukprot:CAMPEP_0197238628 /NCGR_PEP_ID=MMETSP1429-20130617/5145_1 /TAXON_ID=49237 /ORGANISM="Chaetoceros  sp., Strain UNC1202" /LENGTH=340 /DNA_ID=CAMNT_0042697845 /DNA_START=155 /DNA_END=1177 /DNA_ORIENTATION=+